MSDPLITSLEDGVLEITLNRPDQLNAFTVGMHKLLRAAMENARDNPQIRAVILTGAGRGFCAGQDLSERDPKKGEIVDLNKTLTENYNPLVTMMRAMEKPIICAVNGVAAGAGANLALACDIVLASDSAKFIQAFSKIGLIPDAGGTYTLTRLIGEARAKALAMTAMPLGAAKAEEWGLIWKCVPADSLMNEARTLARSLAAFCHPWHWQNQAGHSGSQHQHIGTATHSGSKDPGRTRRKLGFQGRRSGLSGKTSGKIHRQINHGNQRTGTGREKRRCHVGE